MATAMTMPDGRYVPDPLEVRPEDASETEDILAGALDEDDVAPEDRPREALVLDEPIKLELVETKTFGSRARRGGLVLRSAVAWTCSDTIGAQRSPAPPKESS